MSHWDFSRPPAAEQQDEATTPDDEVSGPYPITYERGRIEPDGSGTGSGFGSGLAGAPAEADDQNDPYYPHERWPSAPVPDDPFPAGAWPGDRPPWPGRRWLIPAAVALATAIGGAAVLLTSGHPGHPATRAAGAAAAAPRPAARAASPAPSAQAAPPLSLAQARSVLAGYTATDNAANAQRSVALLAMIETGSSDAIDKILYLRQQAAGAQPYPAFGPASAAYYIPRAEPAAGPRWFVVRVANAFFSRPEKVSSTEYLVFLQATAGAPWRDAIEPYRLPGARVPPIAVGGDGLATAVAATATSLAAAPVRLPDLTAATLDGAGPVAVGGDLADLADTRSWRRAVPALTVTGRHAPATAGQAFALRTAGGGALVFYTVAAGVSATGPGGAPFHLNVPGLYAPAQSLRRAALQYRDQFAAYDPPAGAGAPRVVAEYSGITRKM